MKKNIAGVSMLELIISVAIIGIFFASAALVFNVIGKAIMITRTRTVANNLAQEQIESLKNVSYFRLRVTSLSDYTSFGYDKTYYPPETGILVGDLPYERRVLIRRVRENASGELEEVLPDGGDTSLKKITVTVVWTEQNETKSLFVSNLKEDPNRRPMDGIISGTVTGGGSALSGAVVSIVDNINWNCSSDASGNYEIRVPTGTYKVKAARTGFFVHVSTDIKVSDIDISGPTVYNINLQKMALGAATGYVFINDHLVISKIVASTQTFFGENLEWVELYNPTTFYWAMIDQSTFEIEYQDKNNNPPSDIELVCVSTWLPPNSYYLIASTRTVVLGTAQSSYTVKADAYYNTTQAQDTIDSDRGGLILKREPGSYQLDCVGWRKGGWGPPSSALEVAPIEGDLDPGKTHVRCAAPDLSDTNISNAFDSDNNSYNFLASVFFTTYTYIPLSTSTARTPISGYPAYNALIICNDGVSSLTRSYLVSPIGTYNLAYFKLPNIATGTWNVSMYYSSGSYKCSLEISTVTVLTGGTTVGIPNNITSPNWPGTGLNYAILNSTLTVGFVNGYVRCSGVGVNNIKVEATNSTQSSSSGKYTLALEEGLYNITANSNLLNPSYKPNYISLTLGPLSVSAGNVYNLDFDLSFGGTLGGRVKTIAGDNLPDVVVVARDINGIEVGSGITNSLGLFFIPNLASSSTPHNLQPILDSGESSSPVSSNHTVTMGQTMYPLVSTFTVSSAYGNFIGSVTYNNALIKTGVLILATTMSFSGPPYVAPESIDYGMRTSSPTVYGTVSHSDGTYTLPVRAGTYNIYAWYTIMSAGTPTTKCSYSGNKTVAAGANKIVFFPDSAWAP